LETPARAAISSVDVASNPFSANSARPTSSSCSRRSRPVMRTRGLPVDSTIEKDGRMRVTPRTRSHACDGRE
jgi:hypothetical protein